MFKKNHKLVIIGTGGHSKVCVDICNLNKINIQGYITEKKVNGSNLEKLDHPIIGKLENIDKIHKKNYQYFIAIGDNKIRTKIFNLLKDSFDLINLIHPKSIISKNSKLGKNIIINAGAIINSNVLIENNCIINTGCIIEHDVQIQKNAHICPGVKIAGSVNIGENVFVGIGSSIINNINIGKNVIVGAGSVVIKNISPNINVAGVPAKKLKKNKN